MYCALVETDAACSWWDSWADYTGFHLSDGNSPTVRERNESEASPARPPAIDNEPLQKLGGFDRTELKNDLQEGKDYKLVCESTWKLLHSWYGGEPAFYRQWVEGPQPYVEVYALQLSIKRHSDQSQAVLFISRQVLPCVSGNACSMLPNACLQFDNKMHTLHSMKQPC